MISSSQNELIKSHATLAERIAGKKILHLQSFGKDSMATLVWLSAFAKVKIVSINFSFLANHPGDKPYMDYLKKKFPDVEFVQFQNTQELNKIRRGIYQSPIDMLREFNHWEHIELSFDLVIEEMRKKYECDYTCWGHSKYESVTRATGFYKRGLMQDTKIFPLGLLTKKQVLSIAKTIKLHPCYKTSPSTYDFISYYKMKTAFDKNPEYERKVLEYFPLLVLDKFRYEVLFGKGKVK